MILPARCWVLPSAGSKMMSPSAIGALSKLTAPETVYSGGPLGPQPARGSKQPNANTPHNRCNMGKLTIRDIENRQPSRRESMRDLSELGDGGIGDGATSCCPPLRRRR